MDWNDFARYTCARLGADLPDPTELTPDSTWALADDRFAAIEAELRANAARIIRARDTLAALVALVEKNPRQYQYDAELGALVDEARALSAQ